MNDGRGNDLPDFQIFRTVFSYCLLIIVLPVLSFFTIKNVVFDSFGLASMQSNVYSAVFAVVVLHIALGMYIYRAYNDTERKPDKPVKID